MKIFCFFTLFIMLFAVGYGQDIHKILSNIPENDRELIYSLFHYLVRDQFAYTLFADKPISLSGNFTITPMNNILCGFRCGGCFWHEWEIWNKYKDNFKITNYILFDENYEDSKDNRFVVLINKKAFINIIKEHNDVFDEILGKHIQAENLLRDIELKRISFQGAIKNNELLWGILLGYGEHNAKLYAERDKFLNLKDLEKRTVVPLSVEELNKVDEKIKSLNQQLQPFGEHHYLPLISDDVYFVADPEHPETKALEKKYQKFRGRISVIYSKGDFLEITLSKLIEID
jgi:hypothetical protein